MTTKNNITGDTLATKPATDAYRDNWDRIFGKTHCMCEVCRGGVLHSSDCAVHNAPAHPPGTCDCNSNDKP